MEENDLKLLRRAFVLARQARERGDQPFGAVLADGDGRVLIEAANSAASEHDCTAHAELNLVRAATRRLDRGALARCTVYASGEPCAMCAGAILWSGIGRLVFGLSTTRLHEELIGDLTIEPALAIPCGEIFARGRPRVEVVGPVLEDEAIEPHVGHWRPQRG